MLNTTLGQVLINSELPEDLRDHNRVLDGKGIQELFQQVAEKYPDKYREISKKLMDVSREVAYASGGMSFGLSHLKQAESAKAHKQRLSGRIGEILRDPNMSDTLDPHIGLSGREKALAEFLNDSRKPMEDDILKESLAENNPLGHQVKSKARGNPTQLSSLRGADLLYVDSKDRPIPIPILRSFSQGQSAAEYYAGSFGARRGVVETKLNTQDAGAYAKQLAQASHRLVVTSRDADKEPDTIRGLPVKVDDPDNAGALLAHPIGPYKRNQHLTPQVLSHIKSLGHDRLLIRSPLVGGPPEGGVYSHDVGYRERGMLAPIGDNVGLGASQSISEKISQGSLCLAIGTSVRMANRTNKNIENIEIGDWVMGSDLEGNSFPVQVKHKYNNGYKDCVETIFNIGQSKEEISLRSTLDHKVLAFTRYWAVPSEIRKYGLVPVSEKCVGFGSYMRKSVIEFKKESQEPYALLLGLLLGDGCYKKSVNGVYLSCFDKSLIEDITPYLNSLGLRAHLCAGQRGYWRITQIKDTIRRDAKTGRVLPGDRHPALIKLKSYGMYDKYAHEKTIPEEVWDWSTEDIAELLAGLIVTDGSVYVENQTKNKQVRISFGSTSKKLVEQFRELLDICFAIHTGSIKENNYGLRKRTLYSVVISRRQDIMKFKNSIKLYGIKRKTINSTVDSSYYSADRDFCKFYRKSSTSIGSTLTFDIEVDHPDHLFVLANGLIVSNSSKHKGGVAEKKTGPSGFKLLDQLVQVPEHFPGGVVHSQADGKVSEIQEAPTGGWYVHVGEHEHYVSPENTLKVKVGDRLEAGDSLSDGIPNPSELVMHKGIGEGARSFIDVYRQACEDSDIPVHRRNLELVAKGLINHVKLDEELGDHLPGDVVPYTTLENNWKIRPGFRTMNPRDAVGKYLERPVLHHTIGTQIKPSMLPDLEEFGVKNLTVHDEPPPFKPTMIQARYNLSNDPDWFTRMLGSNLKKNLLQNTWRGGKSDEAGTSFVPGLAKAVDFGRTGFVKDWHDGVLTGVK